MARYIDAIIIPVPTKKMKIYTAIAKKTAKAWIKYGALECVKTVADDVLKGKVTSFPRSVKLKSTETVVFTYIVYKSRAHREQVFTKMMKDESVMKLWDEIPCDGMRMIFGGFKSIVAV